MKVRTARNSSNPDWQWQGVLVVGGWRLGSAVRPSPSSAIANSQQLHSHGPSLALAQQLIVVSPALRVLIKHLPVTEEDDSRVVSRPAANTPNL